MGKTGEGVVDLLGMSFVSVAGGATEFAATDPVNGTGTILAISLQGAGQGIGAAIAGQFVTLAMVDGIPASGADIASGELLFPFVRNSASTSGILSFGAQHGILRLSFPMEVEPRGRRFAASWANGDSELIIPQILIIFQRCSGKTAAEGGACWS